MTNPNTTSSSSRKKMLRAMLVAPVAIGVLAGALVAGTGIGSAASADGTGSAELTTGSPESTPGYTWTLANDTDQPIWGDLIKETSVERSRIMTRSDSPIQPAKFGYSPASAVLPAVPSGEVETIFGQLCFGGNTYHVNRDTPSTAHNYRFGIKQGSYGYPDEGYLTSEQGTLQMYRTVGCS
ncbi:hypothetical protein R3Q06_17870 [Rhodococcus erythropolis]|uniref:hypothetical protein n=1 Tax=Rhodococcus erythropolis TaxID=1833 RepID=UPI00294A1628|nr:hypothetical protein [Rhodococcus erythropolis]MDV6275365.1 hypothetical protein [Rhodococcus erythropolis]